MVSRLFSALGLAVVAFLLVTLGSFLVGVAPGDGQTGMVAIPLWLLGAIFGVAAIFSSRDRSATAQVRTGVLVLALLAGVSVVWSVISAMQYSPKQLPSDGVKGMSR